MRRMDKDHPFLQRSCNHLTRHVCKHYLIQITCADRVSVPQQPAIVNHLTKSDTRQGDKPASASTTAWFFNRAATSSHQRSRRTLIGLECLAVSSSREIL